MTLFNKARMRKLHAKFAPLVMLPLFLTLISGALFQIAELTHNARKFRWLIEIHRGKFGSVNLEMIYPFLNAFGLLMMLVTGIIIWLQSRRRQAN